MGMSSSQAVRVRQIPFARPMIDAAEMSAVTAVLRSDTLVHGPHTEAFEQAFAAFTGAPAAVAVSSCTAAMYLAYLYLGIGLGDEVVVPAQTHVATAHAVELTGARPVFVDAERETGNIDLDQLEDALTAKTRAIAIVHFLGLPVDMQWLMQIATAHDVFVVEDCALALGSYFNGVHAGLWGDVGCFSFYPAKHITTIEGGMMITRQADLAARARRQRAFGVDKTPAERDRPGEYDVPILGGNFRMNEVQAAIGVEQMKKLPEFLAARRRNAGILREGLADVAAVSSFRVGDSAFVSSEYCYAALLDPALVEKKGTIVQYLQAQGVGSSVYYPRPVPHLTYYRKKYGYNLHSFPVAADISRRMIALPVGPHLAEDDMDYMVNVVRNAVS